MTQALLALAHKNTKIHPPKSFDVTSIMATFSLHYTLSVAKEYSAACLHEHQKNGM